MKDRGLSRKMLPRAHTATLRSLTSTYLRAVAGPARMQIADAGDAGTPTRAAAPTGRADAAASGGLPEGRRPVGPVRATARFPLPNGRNGRRARRAGCRQSPRLKQFVEGIPWTTHRPDQAASWPSGRKSRAATASHTERHHQAKGVGNRRVRAESQPRALSTPHHPGGWADRLTDRPLATPKWRRQAARAGTVETGPSR